MYYLVVSLQAFHLSNNKRIAVKKNFIRSNSPADLKCSIGWYIIYQILNTDTKMCQKHFTVVAGQCGATIFKYN